MATKLATVFDAIVGSIESGALKEGDRLPSESELATAHGVSVGTMQKVLARLAHSGLVSREQGRGTFVSGIKAAPADIRYLRFRNSEGRELAHYVQVHSIKRIKRTGSWSDFLGGDTFVRIERVVNIGGHFDLVSVFWLREEEFTRLEGLSSEELEKNLRELIGKRLSLPTLRVDQSIRFVAATPSTARKLGLEPGHAVLVLELRAHTLRDQPLYYQEVYSGPFSDPLLVAREKAI
ncbi:GntR family transcriptional regulator [Hydrogenophaga sp. 2FB]|uniref:GntR family transcriptional regulator n=1 Tax=Hydrogenophaga sp. 2FB TaxID=2502187 RepID=UPI0010F56B1E|nr:GntR family transcriptional regulator [Hydrogenophaga sp. 2FB]